MTVKYAMDPDVFELEENTPESLLNVFENLLIIRTQRSWLLFIQKKNRDELLANIQKVISKIQTKEWSKNEIYKKIYNEANKISEILTTDISGLENIILRDEEEKSFENFINCLAAKFSKNFLDCVLVFDQIEMNAKDNVMEFLLKDNKIKRDFHLSPNSGKGYIKNFAQLKENILDELGYGDLNTNSLFLIEPEFIRSLVYGKKTEMEIKVTTRALIFYILEKYKNKNIKPSIYIVADNTENRNTRENGGLSTIAKKFEKELEEELGNVINIKVIVARRWEKKQEDQQRFVYSRNYHGYSLNTGFNFLGVGIKGTNDEQYKNLNKNSYNQLKVVKHLKIKEVLDKKVLNFIDSICKTKQSSDQSQLYEGLSRLGYNG